MINVYHFENSLKLEWVKRLILQNSYDPPPLCTLLTNLVGDLGKITTLGGDWCKLLEKKLKTPSGSMFLSSYQTFVLEECQKITPVTIMV